MTGTELKMELVGSQAEIPAELWEVCFPPPLEGRWWYQTLEQSGLGDQFTFSYAVLQQNAQSVGIVPLFRMSLPLQMILPDLMLPIGRFLERLAPDFMRPPTLFIGSPCSDEGTIGLLPGVDRKIALLFLQNALEQHARKIRARLLIWKDMPAEWSQDFGWLMKQRRVFKSISYPGTMLQLPGHSKEQYMAALKTSRRHHLRRNLRRSRERISLRIETLQRPDAAILDKIFSLYWQTYEHASVKFERLNRSFFEHVAEKSVAHFVLLRSEAGNEIVAFMLCFLMGERVVNKFIGIDRMQADNTYLLLRLWDAMLDWALNQGATSIQSGQTGYSAKLLTGHDLVPLNSYCHVHNPAYHALFRFFGIRVKWEDLDKDLFDAIKAHPEMGRAQYV